MPATTLPAAPTPTTPGIVMTEEDHLRRLRRARPHPLRQIGEAAALLVVICSLLAEFRVVQRGVDQAAQARESPVHYLGRWEATKPFFRPGEDATFKFVRAANFPGNELYIINYASFENNDTGITYSAGMVVKRLDENERGSHSGYGQWTVPANAKPGKNYTFDGLVRSETVYRTLPEGYSSAPFEIRAWLSEQERARYDAENKAAAAAKAKNTELDAPEEFASK